ncbi:MAG: hypothetical protein KGL74_03175 [Elusimicrobia bacterium]|nr:hypothetical protein [Elusimicrobiota bacterium]MDE2510103.1 hypothetical protein [Elusimicrobiota bacterium]
MSPRPPRRDPLLTALVLINLGLGTVLLYRHFHPRVHGGLPPGHPDVSVPDMPAAAPAFAVSGTVRKSAALKDPWPARASVFVIARAGADGPPYAVRRYDGVKAPFAYALGPDNVMLSGAPLPARLAVTVRVDQDGDAVTRQLGDLEGGPVPARQDAPSDVTVDRPATLVP